MGKFLKNNFRIMGINLINNKLFIGSTFFGMSYILIKKFD